MLPLQLLRFKVTNKGKNITPLFCHLSDNRFDASSIQLAKKMIEELNDSISKKEPKGVFMKKVALLESEYDDYKLVRGFYTLLQRRCIYGYNYILKDKGQGPGEKLSKENSIESSFRSVFENKNVEPSVIRRLLFESASETGYPLTDIKRTEIVSVVAAKINISVENLSKIMWSDLEENLILERFDGISAEQLVAWYNLSLIQTLLFNCTKLEFSLRDGINWKHALRAVKRLGLMYNLERRSSADESSVAEGMPGDKIYNHDSLKSESNGDIICSIDGPLTIFKLTDRYGTAISKLVPYIISSYGWSLKAWIVRKTLSSGKKIYQFDMSQETSPDLIAEPLLSNANSKEQHLSDHDYYDSNVEKKFANKFLRSINDWKLSREPDPLILANGKALIPDFIFEKYDRKIYLEIIGFWTKDYLLRKINKLKAITDLAKTNLSNKIDLLIAINHEVYASSSSNLAETRAWNALISSITDKKVILYKNNDIQLKPILDYLRSIDQEVTKDLVLNGSTEIMSNLLQTINKDHNDVISVTELAEKWNIEFDILFRIIRSSVQNSDHIGRYVIADKYLILDTKIEKLRGLFDNARRLSDANRILADNSIPESCLLYIITKFGFDIIWDGMDYSRASIKKKDFALSK
ncbi:MAG: DUF790 family protein [Nitrososphaeraceae archaeon]